MNYKIFTDSSSGLPKSVTEKYPLNVIPVPMTINGEEVTVKSDDDVFLKNFYVKLRENASMSTSCVNKQSFLNRFTPALESGYDVLYIGLSSGLPSTMQNACDASKELKEKEENLIKAQREYQEVIKKAMDIHGEKGSKDE